MPAGFDVVMVICFNSTPEAKRALDSLISTEQYRDASEAISMALVNYDVIQQAVKDGDGVLSISAAPAPAASKQHAERTSPKATNVSGLHVAPQIPNLFELGTNRPNDEDLLPVEAAQANYKSFGPKDWLFGQWNRFLPVKDTSRALLNIMCEHALGIPVKDAASKISYAACDLGDYLRMLDARHSRRREDSVSAAFPSTAHLGAESRLRYGNQFVGTIRQGKLIGLPAALRFVAHDAAKDPRLRLSIAGAEFAALPNPLLDPGIAEPAYKFTDDEIRFLLKHIQSFIPEEVSAFASIIDAITDGANTPDKMDTFLRARFGLKEEAAMTATFLSTQRTGAIARLADLGLVYREKIGLRVTYTVSHPGQCFRRQIA